MNKIISLREKGIINEDVLHELNDNFESHALIIKREIERFSSDQNIAVYESLMTGLSYLQIPELAPRLYMHMLKLDK